jgi:hypothetical protein
MRKYLLLALPIVLLLFAAFIRPAGTQTTAVPAAKVFFKINCADYTAMSGVQKENGNTTVGYFDNKDWMSYKDLNFDENGKYLNLLVQPLQNNGKIEFRLDDLANPAIGSYTVTNATRSWEDISV